MKQTSPVFIMGTKRSGTSILYRTLQKHPVFTPRQLDLTETAVFKKADKAYRFNSKRPWQLINYMLKDQTQYQRFLATIRPLQRLQQILDPGRIPSRVCRRHSLTRQWWWLLLQSHLVVRSYFYYAQKARDCRRLVEKTPHNLEFIPQILHTFPQAKLICLLRHPIDVFSSRRRRGQMDDANHGHLLMSPPAFCRLYQKEVDQIIKHKQIQPGFLLTVRYESFTRDPAAEFARVCTFLDVPYREEAVVEKNPDPDRWRPDPHLFGPIVAKTKEWQDYVTIDEARLIEQTLMPVLAKLDYAPYVL